MRKYFYSIFIVLFSLSFTYAQETQNTNKKITKITHKYSYENNVLKIKKDTSYNKYAWYVPTAYRLQFAGNMGFLSVGANYYLSKTFDVSLLVGYFREGIESGKLVTISLKSNFKIYNFKLNNKYSFIPTAGVNVIWGHTHNTFKALPAHYPDKYYFQNEIHFAPYIGYIISRKVDNKYLSAIEFYSEIGSMDNYVLEYIRNEYIELKDIINVSFGITLKLKNHY